VTTRRGKQFNSMVYGAKDPLTGNLRDAVLMSEQDGAALGVKTGDRVRLKSEAGEYVGRAVLAPLHPRTIQLHWPEGSVLLTRCYDQISCEPNFKAFAEVTKAAD